MSILSVSVLWQKRVVDLQSVYPSSLLKKVRLQCTWVFIITLKQTIHIRWLTCTYAHTHSYITIIHMHTALFNTVGRLKTSQNHPTSVHIYWAAIWEDIVTGYVVQVEGPDSTQEIPIRNKYITSVEISDLLPSTQYSFKVKALKRTDKIYLNHPTKIVYTQCHNYILCSSQWCS